MPRALIFVLIVALCGALDIGLHMAGGDLMPMPSAFSPLVERFGFGVVVIIWIALAFSGMGLLFLFCSGRGACRAPGGRRGCAMAYHWG